MAVPEEVRSQEPQVTRVGAGTKATEHWRSVIAGTKTTAAVETEAGWLSPN